MVYKIRNVEDLSSVPIASEEANPCYHRCYADFTDSIHIVFFVIMSSYGSSPPKKDAEFSASFSLYYHQSKNFDRSSAKRLPRAMPLRES